MEPATNDSALVTKRQTSVVLVWFPCSESDPIDCTLLTRNCCQLVILLGNMAAKYISSPPSSIPYL